MPCRAGRGKVSGNAAVHAVKGTAFFRRGGYPVALLFLSISLFGTGTAAADMLNGFMEWDYSHVNSTARDAAGTTNSTKGDLFTQRYNLMLNRSFFPLLTLRAGYIWENDQNWLTMNDKDNSSTITTSLPSFDLFMGSQMLNAAVGYRRRKESQTTSGASSKDLYNEDYHATFGWRPEGLPAMSLLVTRTNNFDGLRAAENTTDDRATFGMRYSPLKGVDLKYTFNYDDLTDKLVDLDVKQVTHSGRINYSDRFFHDRMSLYANYTVSIQDTTTNTSGKGVVDQQITPFDGLYGQNDPPTQGQVAPSHPELINGTASIDIGTMLPPQQPRNMGFDFQNPQTTVNRVLVWVTVPTTGSISDFRKSIAPLYKWSVYISPDNTSWTQIAVDSSSFGAFDNRFEIKFAPVQAQYLKVVVTPLDQNTVQAMAIPGFQPPFSVTVTKIEAFNEVPAASVQGTTAILSHNLNTDVKVRLLDSPSLPTIYYDGSFFFTSSSPSGFTKWTLDNALLADHRFNRIVSASARVAREDSGEPDGYRVSYSYNATMRVTPLATLTHTLTYSGRTEEFQGKTSNSNSLFLSNTAELYPGVNLNTSGGVSFATTETGEKDKTYNFLLGLNIVPRRDLAFNINYSYNQSNLSGGGQVDSTSTTSRGDFGVTYRPVASLYLLASLALLEQTGRQANVYQNYGVNWSPFADGALQLNFAYAENLQTLNQQKSRQITPGLTWKITGRTTLDVSYSLLKTESTLGTSDSRTLSAILRTSF